MTTTTATELRDGTWTVLPEQTTAAFRVRNWGLIRVRGTIPVTDGSVTVSAGQPVAATATLDPAGIATGIRKRDSDLRGKHFLDVERHPLLTVRVDGVRPAGDCWTARAWLTVAGQDAPVELTVRREADPGPGTFRVVATGVLDRAATPIRVPRAMVGRRVEITVTATARSGPPAPSPSE